MQNETANSNGQRGKRNAYVPTREDVAGMFEAGLEELGRHFHFDAANVAGGVVLTISGITRVDDESAGTWHLQPLAGDASGDESARESDEDES